MTDIQSQYNRYYFYINGNHQITVQLSNDSMKDCLDRSYNVIHELVKRLPADIVLPPTDSGLVPEAEDK